MNRIALSRTVLAVAVGCVVLAGYQAKAAVVVGDDFTGSGALNGRAPTVAQHAGDVWSDIKSTGVGAINTSGSLTVVAPVVGGTAQAASAQLPFTPDAGQVYTLSATVARATTGWIGIGFQTSTGALLGNDPTSSSTGVYGLLISDRSTGGKAFGGAGAGNQIGGTLSTAPTGSSHVLSIKLDTTGAQWVITPTIDGVAFSPASSYTYPLVSGNPSNPAIRYVMIGESGLAANAGTITSFQVTTVPEPASIAVLGLASLFGLRRRRV
jgi:hypothetical protein